MWLSDHLRRGNERTRPARRSPQHGPVALVLTGEQRRRRGLGRWFAPRGAGIGAASDRAGEKEGRLWRPIARNSSEDHLRIGEILVERGLITSAQLAAALSEQRGTGEKIGEVLLRRGLVRPHDLQHSLAHQSRMLMAAAALAVGGMLSPSLGGASASSAAESAAIAVPVDDAVIATLTAVTGSVRVLAPDGQTKSARAGAAIRLGDRVTTDDAARAVIALRGGGVLVMRDAGTLVVDETLLGDDRGRNGTVAGVIESAFRYLSDLVGVRESRRVSGIAPTIGIRG